MANDMNNPAFDGSKTEPTCECGSTDFYTTPDGFDVCRICGLVNNDERIEFEQNTYDSDKFNRQKATAKKVRAGRDRDFGSVINLGKDIKFRNNKLANRLAKSQKYTVTRVNSTDVHNRNMLNVLLDEAEIDGITSTRARDVLTDVVELNDHLVKMARKTSNSINLSFLGALVSVIDERVNLECKHMEKILDWVIETTINAMNIDEKTQKTCDDVLKRASEKTINLDEYALIIHRLESIERSRLDWIERVEKSVRSKFARFRTEIDGSIDFLRNNKKKVTFLLSQAGVNQYIDKIIRLVEKTREPNLMIDYLTFACAATVYAYYGKTVDFNFRTQRMEKYMRYIENRCGFVIRDGELNDENGVVADIIRPLIIIIERNDIWEDVFNDEYDKALESTMAFCEEIRRHDLELIADIVAKRYYDINYVKYILKSEHRDEVFDIIEIAPFVNIDEKNGVIEYSGFIDDIEKEIKIFLRRGNAVEQNGNTKMWIGKRRGSRESKDEYSLNVLVKKKSGDGVWQQWIPVGEVKEIISFIFEQDAPISASSVTMQLVELGYTFNCTGSLFTKSHRCKIYTIFQLLRENMLLKKQGRGYATTVEIDDAIAFVDSIEVKH